VIYIVKAQSFLRSPLVSLIVEGEDWLVGFDPIFEKNYRKLGSWHGRKRDRRFS